MMPENVSSLKTQEPCGTSPSHDPQEHQQKSELLSDGDDDDVTPCFGRPKNPILKFMVWYLSWALPGFGMFSTAYIIFSLGQIKPFQKVMYHDCFASYKDGCSEHIVNNQSYIQFCGIIAGMLIWGYLGDLIGRKWGSRCVSAIMLSGTILLTFTPFTTGDPAGGFQYLTFFIVAETWYGFGVGGEYPMAAVSAAERAEKSQSRRDLRGREMVLTFSGQGMGNFVNSVVILLSMAVFGQTGALTFQGSRDVMALQAGIGAILAVFLVWYRFTYLKESEMYMEERKAEANVLKSGSHSHESRSFNLHWTSFKYYWPRVMMVSLTWIASDFAFYGNKLFQSTFIALLYPGSTQYEQQKWTILNNFVALCGYFLAAWLVDKRWYGRMHMQANGFIMMCILYGVCAVAYVQLTGSEPGLHAFQFLYFFSSFWNQFGPNCTTFLVAGEIFPTDVRSSYHGFNAAMGKVGAIVAGMVFGYVSPRDTFYISAACGLFGAVLTWLFLPDATGLNLEEYDEMQRHILAGTFEQYHGEAINPKHLSLYERCVLGWSANYDPVLDRQLRQVETPALSAASKAAMQHDGALGHNMVHIVEAHLHDGADTSAEASTRSSAQLEPPLPLTQPPLLPATMAAEAPASMHSTPDNAGTPVTVIAAGAFPLDTDAAAAAVAAAVAAAAVAAPSTPPAVLQAEDAA